MNGRLEPRDPAAFLIDAHPERQLPGERLRVARDIGHLIGRHDVAREENDPAEIELPREQSEIRRNGIAGEPGNRELTDVTTNVATGTCLVDYRRGYVSQAQGSGKPSNTCSKILPER